MTERPDDLHDQLLGARLTSALGTPPPQLTARLVRLTAAGLRAAPSERRTAPFWAEVLRQSASTALVLALLAGLLPRFLALVTGPSSLLARVVSASRSIVSPVVVWSLVLPLGILLAVEALRGAPTTRRWV